MNVLLLLIGQVLPPAHPIIDKRTMYELELLERKERVKQRGIAKGQFRRRNYYQRWYYQRWRYYR